MKKFQSGFRFWCIICMILSVLLSGTVSAKVTESKQVYVKKKGEFLEIKATDANQTQRVTFEGENARMEQGGYLVYKNIKFTEDAKYVTIEASRHNVDEERYLFRIDSPTGEIIADCKADETGSTDSFGKFTGQVKTVSGVHDLYVVSEFGVSDARLKSFVFSEKDTTTYRVPQANVIDNYHDTWVAVDGAGRAVADYEETGDVRDGKYVAMFYWTWHENWADRTAPVNVSAILEKHPEIMHDEPNDLWPSAPAYFWAEPLFGHYRTSDPWVLRKHAQMLANAGVDVIVFDCTNGDVSHEAGYYELIKAFSEARADGINAPKVAFMSNFWSDVTAANLMTKVYKNIYRDGKYRDSWFYWKGKPLIMAYPESLNNAGSDPETKKLYQEILNFFTFREPQPSYTSGPSRNTQWGWLEAYPQHKYVVNEEGGCEEATAGVAQNHSYVTKQLAAMNDEFAQGRSYTERYGEDLSENAWDYGYNFKEQFEYAIELDPELIFVTGWNEWIAGRYDNWHGTKNAFPDQCNYERSRDIEPVKGKYGDNYYYQLVDMVRKFKGTRPTPTASGKKSIDLSGDLSQWNDVGPDFVNDKGTTIHRDIDGYRGTHYTNTTGRNDILLSKVARDDQNITFYVQTDKTLTEKDGKDWMTLYLNTDRNHATGWEGYDFVINRVSPGSKAYLEYNDTGKWEWKPLSEVSYSVSGNVLQIQVPRSVLGLTEDEIDIEFKWADNIDVSGDAINFLLYGCSAPFGRFNYRYTTKTVAALDDRVKNDLADKIVVKEGCPYLYVGASKMLIWDADTNVVPFTENGTLYIPAKTLEKMIYASKVEIGDEYITVKSDATTLTLYRNGVSRRNGVKLDRSYQIIRKNDVDYIDAAILGDIFGKTLRRTENQLITFSADEVKASTLEAVNQRLK